MRFKIIFKSNSFLKLILKTIIFHRIIYFIVRIKVITSNNIDTRKKHSVLALQPTTDSTFVWLHVYHIILGK
jgi:hypothetical protein